MNGNQKLEFGGHIGESIGDEASFGGARAGVMRMAKRIEELEARVLVMAGLLRETLTYVGGPRWQSLLDDREAHLFLGRVGDALSGKLPTPATPEGWQLVPVEPTKEMSIAGCQVPLNKAARHNTVYRAMLSAAPNQEVK